MKSERIAVDQIDTMLTRQGILKSVIAQSKANKIDIKVVLVSPLRRTIQTAFYIFKNHPNFQKMKFILVPKAREAMVGVADLPGDIDTVINTYSKLFPQGLDTSLIREPRNKWYFDGLTSSAKK